MIDLLILADDFTGALDTAVQFTRKSIDTAVFLYKDLDFTAIDPKVQVAVVDTESRHISGKEAACRVEEIAREALKAGVKLFYKKTDSVLRGNIGSELVGLMQATGASELMFIPAYPDTGRTTLNGCQYLNGLPINKTSFANDPVNPVKDCRIGQIIEKQANIPVTLVSRDGLPNMANDPIDGQRIYVFDAEDNDDLKKIASLLGERGKTTLTAGCAGFAGMLPGMLGLRGRGEGKTAEEKPGGKMLTVCGSVSEVSLRQVRYAKNHNFRSFVLDSHQLLTQDYSATEDGRRFIEETAVKINEGSDVIITAAESFEDRIDSANNPNEMKPTQKDITHLIASNIAGVVKGVAEKANLDTISVIGGDTAVEIALAMGLQSIRPRCEISAGVVLSDTVARGKRISLVTKSGGFGDEDILIKIRDYIKSE